MSCGIIQPIHSGMNMYLSLQQCMRNSLIKNNKLMYCRRLNTQTKWPKNCAVVRISQKKLLGGSWGSPSSFETSLGSQGILTTRRNLIPFESGSYCTKQNVGNEPNADKKIEEEKKLTAFQKLKKLWKEYWYVLFPVHAITSTIWYGSFYYLVVSGIDIPALLASLGAPDSWSEALKNSQAGNFVLAYTLYKVATPIRYTVTLGGTTLSVNVLKRWGWIRPAPTTAQIKQMCRDQKEAFKGLKATCQDKMQVTKDEFLKSKNAMTRQFFEVQEGLQRSIRETGEEFKTAADDFKYIGKVCVKQMKGSRNPLDDKPK